MFSSQCDLNIDSCFNISFVCLGSEALVLRASNGAGCSAVPVSRRAERCRKRVSSALEHVTAGLSGRLPFLQRAVLCGRGCELLPFSCRANYKRELLLALCSLPFHGREVLTSEMSFVLAPLQERSDLKTMSLLPSVADDVCFAAVE